MKTRHMMVSGMDEGQRSLEERTFAFVKSEYCTCFHDVHTAVDNVVTVQRAAAAFGRAMQAAERTLNDLEHGGEMIPPFAAYVARADGR